LSRDYRARLLLSQRVRDSVNPTDGRLPSRRGFLFCV